jgi:hypothetical protein
MTKNEIDVHVQPALAEMTDRALEDRWLTLAVLEDQMTTAEARAWTRDVMAAVSDELARRQK